MFALPTDRADRRQGAEGEHLCSEASRLEAGAGHKRDRPDVWDGHQHHVPHPEPGPATRGETGRPQPNTHSGSQLYTGKTSRTMTRISD